MVVWLCVVLVILLSEIGETEDVVAADAWWMLFVCNGSCRECFPTALYTSMSIVLCQVTQQGIHTPGGGI